jgi:hypothetical protein
MPRRLQSLEICAEAVENLLTCGFAALGLCGLALKHAVRLLTAELNIGNRSDDSVKLFLIHFEPLTTIGANNQCSKLNTSNESLTLMLSATDCGYFT